MLTLDTTNGLAVDYARIYKGTESEPDEDGIEVVLTMMLSDEDELVLAYTEGSHRVTTRIFIPLDRLKKLIKES